MESSNLKLGERQRSAALESITRTREAIAWKLEQESKYLDEYKLQYERQQAKVDALTDELTVLNELVETLGGNMPTPNVLLTDQVDKDEFAPTHTRIQYPSSPKEKIKELVLVSEFFSTDDELVEALQYAFKIPEIPKKTVVNYLQELKKEGVIGRVKSKKLGAYVNGNRDWFDSDGIPLPEFLEYKNLRV